MKYQKANVEVVKFELETFMESSNDIPIGSFTCGKYKKGQYCANVYWPGTGYSCGYYTPPSNCDNVSGKSGSMGDGCNAWNLTCDQF